MSKIGIIANAGLIPFEDCEILQREAKETPYGEPASPLIHGLIQGKEVVVILRNGDNGATLPHLINYRANIWALAESKVSHIIALSPVTSIRGDLTPGSLLVPDQIIDYTYGRAHTFFAEELQTNCHIDFRLPYDPDLCQHIVTCAAAKNLSVCESATYGVIQGPRLATLAEVNRLERDGCDVIGMTSMPETILARELNLHYACIALVTHKAAGKRAALIKSKEYLNSTLKESMQHLHSVLKETILQMTFVDSDEGQK